MVDLTTFQEVAVPLVNSEWFKNTIPVLAFIISVSSLLYTQKALKSNTRTSDLSALLSFVENLEGRENALLTTSAAEEKDVRFVELLNVLETYSAAFNFNLLPRVTRIFVRDKLIDALGLIASMPEWHKKLQNERIGSAAFSEMGKFDSHHRKQIDAVARTFSASDAAGPLP